jgi:hypothetical protein
MTEQITYDKCGRMRYNAGIHTNQDKPWTTTDQNYLIEYYVKLGPEQVSMELGRTIHTVMQRVYVLRKKGLMAKLVKRVNHKRMPRVETA